MKGLFMKKVILLSLAMIGTICIAHSTSDTNYSPKYISNLKSCIPYSETYNIEIPTNDPNTPIIHLQSKETIIGKQNDKCKTKSTVYNVDMKANIIEVNCQFSQAQLASITSKMAKASADPSIKKALQDELTNYVQNDPNTCQAKNLIQQ